MFFYKIKHLRTLMILCVHLTQEKVYHSLDVNFLTQICLPLVQKWTLLGIAFSVSLY